jgi:hypothetical protein
MKFRAPQLTAPGTTPVAENCPSLDFTSQNQEFEFVFVLLRCKRPVENGKRQTLPASCSSDLCSGAAPLRVSSLIKR